MRKSKLQKPKPSPASDLNMLWAIGGLLFVALMASGFTTWACDYVLSSFQNSNTMALIITDAGLKSDDAKLEHQLSSATTALKALRDIGMAVLVGGTGVALAVVIKVKRRVFP